MRSTLESRSPTTLIDSRLARLFLFVVVASIFVVMSRTESVEARHIHSLRVEPSQATAVQGGSASFIVYVTATEGVRAYVQLQATGLPRMGTAEFDPNPVLIECQESQVCQASTTKLTIRTAKSTKPDNYTVTITADPMLQEMEATVLLRVIPIPVSAMPAHAYWLHATCAILTASTLALRQKEPTVVPLLGGSATLLRT